MDKKTADTVEMVTKNWLEEAFADRNVECDVVVASQRFLEVHEEAIRTRRSLRVGGRKLTSDAGLKVDLDLSCTASRNGDDVDIEELLVTELSTNIDDYKQQLADNAMFFLQYNQRVDQKLPNSAVSGKETSQSGNGKWIGIIVGSASALAVVLVASLFVSNRRNLEDINEDGPRDSLELGRSNNKSALRVIDEDEVDTYDLNAISNVKNEAGMKSRKEIAKHTRNISEGIKSKVSVWIFVNFKYFLSFSLIHPLSCFYVIAFQ